MSIPSVISKHYSCGLCGEGLDQDSIVFFSTKSSAAHRSCHKIITETEGYKNVIDTVNRLFPAGGRRNMALSNVIEGIEEECIPLIAYAKRYGIKELNELIANIGIVALDAYASKLIEAYDSKSTRDCKSK